MSYAYSKIYLEEVMTNLGVMMDYGVNSLHLTPGELFSRFISSGIAGHIESGHPRYLAGLSGIEIADMATGLHVENPIIYPGAEYWAGWAIAYLQWKTGYSFSALALCGMDIDKVISMYSPYHEADIIKFAEDAAEIVEVRLRALPSRLKTFRKAMGLTQEGLAEKSGVSVRAIRSYEQNNRSLQKAEVGSLFGLSKTLGCRMEALLDSHNYLLNLP